LDRPHVKSSTSPPSVSSSRKLSLSSNISLREKLFPQTSPGIKRTPRVAGLTSTNDNKPRKRPKPAYAKSVALESTFNKDGVEQPLLNKPSIQDLQQLFPNKSITHLRATRESSTLKNSSEISPPRINSNFKTCFLEEDSFNLFRSDNKTNLHNLNGSCYFEQPPQIPAAQNKPKISSLSAPMKVSSTVSFISRKSIGLGTPTLESFTLKPSISEFSIKSWKNPPSVEDAPDNFPGKLINEVIEKGSILERKLSPKTPTLSRAKRIAKPIVTFQLKANKKKIKQKSTKSLEPQIPDRKATNLKANKPSARCPKPQTTVLRQAMKKRPGVSSKPFCKSSVCIPKEQQSVTAVRIPKATARTPAAVPLIEENKPYIGSVESTFIPKKQTQKQSTCLAATVESHAVIKSPLKVKRINKISSPVPKVLDMSESSVELTEDELSDFGTNIEAGRSEEESPEKAWQRSLEDADLEYMMKFQEFAGRQLYVDVLEFEGITPEEWTNQEKIELTVEMSGASNYGDQSTRDTTPSDVSLEEEKLLASIDNQSRSSKSHNKNSRKMCNLPKKRSANLIRRRSSDREICRYRKRQKTNNRQFGRKSQQEYVLFVTGLPVGVKEEDIRSHFCGLGPVKKLKILRKNDCTFAEVAFFSMDVCRRYIEKCKDYQFGSAQLGTNADYQDTQIEKRNALLTAKKGFKNRPWTRLLYKGNTSQLNNSHHHPRPPFSPHRVIEHTNSKPGFDKEICTPTQSRSPFAKDLSSPIKDSSLFSTPIRNLAQRRSLSGKATCSSTPTRKRGRTKKCSYLGKHYKKGHTLAPPPPPPPNTPPLYHYHPELVRPKDPRASPAARMRRKLGNKTRPGIQKNRMTWL